MAHTKKKDRLAAMTDEQIAEVRRVAKKTADRLRHKADPIRKELDGLRRLQESENQLVRLCDHVLAERGTTARSVEERLGCDDAEAAVRWFLRENNIKWEDL